MPRWLDFVLFQAVWLCAVLGAAQSLAWLGPFAAAVYVGLRLKSGDAMRSLARVGAVAVVVGACVDGALGGFGLVRYAAAVGPAWLAPPWIVALWVAFAATLGGALSWLHPRPLLAVLLGGVAGPLAYWSGARLGALEFGGPSGVSLLAIGGAWALATPLLSRLSMPEPSDAAPRPRAA